MCDFTINDYMEVFMKHGIVVYKIAVENGSMEAKTNKGFCKAMTPKLLDMLYTE